MLIKVGSLYLTLGTFTYDAGNRLIFSAGSEPIRISESETQELERILDEAIAGQKTVEQIVTEQQAQLTELQKRAEVLQQRETYVEGLCLQAQQVITASQQQKSPMILPPGFGRQRRG